MNYDTRLNNLKTRRSLPQEIQKSYAYDKAITHPSIEGFYSLHESPAIRYAIGAMQPVTKRYTEICFEEGDRVAKSLKGSLLAHDIQASHEFQGSVPLDIHIKGASDVDVLVLHNYLTYDEPCPTPNNYTPASDGKSMLARMRELRTHSESILRNNYPAVKVDGSGAKAISMEGGSLQRKIDIVPSHWHDTIDYQNSRNNKDREVKIYDKDNRVTIGNWPFKHMHAINQRNTLYKGNLKKVCRLLKNIKADSPSKLEKSLSYLSSYDIAGLAYHMSGRLNCPTYYDLGLVASTNDFLIDILSNDCAKGKLLSTPDESRLILNTEEKKLGAITLTLEVNKLYKDILQSIAPTLDESTGRILMNNRAVIYG